jgi:hypothetical protein
VPPVDLASGDKHAPVKPAAARRSAVAPPSAMGLEAPVVLLVAQPSRRRGRRRAHDAEQCDEHRISSTAASVFFNLVRC